MLLEGHGVGLGKWVIDSTETTKPALPFGTTPAKSILLCLRWLREPAPTVFRMIRRYGGSGNSVQTDLARNVARQTAQVTLHGGSALALALLGRLLVELALARFGQDAGLLAGTLETTQCDLERLVLANFYVGHGNSGW